ncbi:MAG: hypothetical protein K2Y18_06565 [Alphaproteobacteria bacterium]|jgi:hypothetical protein|nr:hypothetical protein [Alphaproteobacteria bacterium]
MKKRLLILILGISFTLQALAMEKENSFPENAEATGILRKRETDDTKKDEENLVKAPKQVNSGWPLDDLCTRHIFRQMGNWYAKRLMTVCTEFLNAARAVVFSRTTKLTLKRNSFAFMV